MDDKKPSLEIQKPIASLTILVYADKKIEIRPSFTNQEDIYDILKAAEEIILRKALQAASQKPTLIHAPAMPGLTEGLDQKPS